MLNVSMKAQDSDVNASLGTAVMECRVQVKSQHFYSYVGVHGIARLLVILVGRLYAGSCLLLRQYWSNTRPGVQSSHTH